MTVDPASIGATSSVPSPTNPTNATAGLTTTVDGKKALGKDAFLSLLVTQLKNQDPTKPMDDTEFVAQLATFSSLEKLTTMDQSLGSILRLLQGEPPSATAGTTTGTPGTTAGTTGAIGTKPITGSTTGN